MKVIIAGDFCDRNRVSEAIRAGNYEAMFRDISYIVKSADFAIVNFEFPIAIEGSHPIPKCGPNLNGHPKAIEAIKYAGFNVCTLANNHILDQGTKCCLDTMNMLENAGIKTVGVGSCLEEASKILYLTKDDNKIAVINCAEHEFSYATETTAGANPINPIQQYHQIVEARQKADYVIVIVHGGHEHFNLPSPRMKELYRFFIEVGADAIVNHHQHCFSGYEVYKGKPIFYGLGNLLFDEPRFKDSFWNKGYMVELELHGGNVGFHTVPYMQCNSEPTVSLLDNNQIAKFEKELKELNSLLIDDKKLNDIISEYYSSSIETELCSLEPYRGRLLSKLFYMGLLPKLIKGSKIPEILNHVNCESHRDKLIYALTKMNK